jgi:hypothetical protein
MALNILKLKKTDIKLKLIESNKVNPIVLKNYFRKFHITFTSIHILMYNIDINLLAGDWFCYGK